MNLSVIDLGLISFKEAFYKQIEIHRQVYLGKTSHTLILCQHPHTITLGKLSRPSSILDYNFIKENNIDFMVGVNRGGDITYHGPGQLVGYLIFDLRKLGRDLGGFLNKIEETLIRTINSFGIAAQSRMGFRGAWINGRKIASIGIGVEKWVSLHGLGLNVNTDLSFFKLIKPCGLDVQMTSMQEELGLYVMMEKVKEKIVEDIYDVFRVIAERYSLRQYSHCL